MGADERARVHRPRSITAGRNNYVRACCASEIREDAVAIELRPADGQADRPFDMVEFAAPDGANKDQWRQIKADILSELPN